VDEADWRIINRRPRLNPRFGTVKLHELNQPPGWVEFEGVKLLATGQVPDGHDDGGGQFV
jgi:hypothetical protein